MKWRPHFTIAAQPSAVVTGVLDYTHITRDLSSRWETLSTTSPIEAAPIKVVQHWIKNNLSNHKYLSELEHLGYDTEVTVAFSGVPMIVAKV